MAVRIVAGEAKVTYVIVGYVLGIVIALAVAFIADATFAILALGVFLLALVLFAGRTFRGEGEPLQPPRPWWKLTARPTSAYLLAAVFAIQGMYSFVALGAPGSGPMWMVAATVHFAIAVGFVNSAVRTHAAMESPDGA